jgi:hypothetical protein
LVPTYQQHYLRISRAAEQLHQNIKRICEGIGDLEGDVTHGEVETKSEQFSIRDELDNVDRLDAACLLEHLKEMYPGDEAIQGIGDWQSFCDKVSVKKLRIEIYDILKQVSHGAQILGRCQICRTWPR